MCLLMFISTVDVIGTLKVIQALPGMPKPVTETELTIFFKANSTYRSPPLTKKDILSFNPPGSSMTMTLARYTQARQK
jgi:hypothetical protein